MISKQLKTSFMRILAVGLLSPMLYACTTTNPIPQPITIEDVDENTSTWLGKQVTVSGEIENVYSPRLFKLGGTEFFDHEIRVITAQPLKPSVQRRADQPFQPDDIALVTGVVRTMTVVEIEREFGFDLGREIELEFESKPVIIASSVLISPRRGNPVSALQQQQKNGIADWKALVSPAEQANLDGKIVRLESIQVQSVVGDESFWVGTGPSQKMFITFPEIPTLGKAREGRLAIKQGQQVSLWGIVRRMPPLADAWVKRNRVDVRMAAEIQKQPFYVVAFQLQVVNPAH